MKKWCTSTVINVFRGITGAENCIFRMEPLTGLVSLVKSKWSAHTRKADYFCLQQNLCLLQSKVNEVQKSRNNSPRGWPGELLAIFAAFDSVRENGNWRQYLCLEKVVSNIFCEGWGTGSRSRNIQYSCNSLYHMSHTIIILLNMSSIGKGFASAQA